MKGGKDKGVRYTGDSQLWNSIRFLSTIAFGFLSIKFHYIFNFVFYSILIPSSSHFVYSLLWKTNPFGLCPWLRLRKKFVILCLFISLLYCWFQSVRPLFSVDCSRLVKGVARFRGWDECCASACFT